MEAKKFLIRELAKLAKQLGDVRLRYKYDEHEEAHVVEVTPKAAFSSDKFMLLGIEAEERFNARFPSEWLAFISDDNGMGIGDFDGEEYTICGTLEPKVESRKVESRK
jgi:hypothetical protein